MKKLLNAVFFLVIVGLLLPCCQLRADIDEADYQASLNPNFSLNNKDFGHFSTEVIEMPQAVNNVSINAEVNPSPDAQVRSYARFRYSETGRWTDFFSYEGEYHFSAIDTVSAYQLMFIIRDVKKGKTSINSINVQGNFVERDLMEWTLQQPESYAPKAWAKPTIISRQAWGARPPKSNYSKHSPQRIIVHHSYIPNQSQYKGAASIRGIQNYHMDDPKTKWQDIGYHFLIGPEGTIYQGRPETVIGAHCSPNTNAVGICLIGDYDQNGDTLTAASEKSLLELMSWIASNYKVNPATNIFGHHDFSTKSCPGTTVYKRLPEFRTKVGNNIN